MSPRRSSRARTTQATPSVPKHSNSSSSSMTSGRASRSAGPDQGPPSRSQSFEDLDAAQPRRGRRSQDTVKDEATNAIDEDVEDESEEELTRCICGNQEYPGLPVSVGDSGKDSSKIGSDPATFAEDTTGWFIQCDDCKVWQHGGCVGIMDEATSPEEYFCEQCRKDLHKITSMANGRKYSTYIPIQESKSPQSSPISVPKKHSKKPKNGKAAPLNADSISKGRRSTMNSRDAAYAEEQLRIAIEESKRDGEPLSTAAGTRKGKRSRSDGDERLEDAKRQRTSSGSTSSASQSKSHHEDSHTEEEEVQKRERPKHVRGAAARNQKNKEARNREIQREKERTDTGRRKGRIRQDDESRSATPEANFRSASNRGNKPATNSYSTPTVPDHPPAKASHKKTGRPPARKGRIGRNQYTKDRDPLSHNDSHNKSSPAPSNSSQNADGSTPHTNGYMNGDGNNAVGKPSKPRHMNPSRTTMNDMKRRVAGILEFISHTQVDMAGTATAMTTKSSSSTNTPFNGNGTEKVGQLSGKAVNAALQDVDAIDEPGFAGLSSLEMMEVLTRRLMKWQGEYGKWGDK